MGCLKCGRDTEPGQVFCPTCLASMKQYPVKPGTPVSIPNRPKRKSTSGPKREEPSEQIQRLQRTVLRLTVMVFLLFTLLGTSLVILANHYLTTDHNLPAIGQNYSTDTPTPSQNTNSPSRR